jgi:glycosyltransferase involved in cell wall biosynthesis
MKILHINSSLNGGAAKSAYRIHNSLLNIGVDSNFLTKDLIRKKDISLKYSYDKLISIRPELTLKNYFYEKFTKKFTKEIKQFSKERDLFLKKINPVENGDFEMFSTPFSEYDITNLQEYKDADIVHLHWISGLIDFETFFKKNSKPIVWTLHDENPFRGAFHYENDEIKNKNLFCDLDKQYVNIKKESYKFIKNLSIVSPSNWLKTRAEQSGVFCDASFFHQNYSIDTNIFHYTSQEFSKSIFNIPNNRKVFAFVSENIHNYRKGYDILIDIVNNENFKDVIFLIVGKSDNDILKNENVIYTGKIYDERLMNIVYNCADFFLLPSREDNQPNTLVEALTSGTPVIAFNISDNRNILEMNNIGLICDIKNDFSLENTMLDCLNGKYFFDRELISKRASQLFSQSLGANFYLELYNKIKK